MTPFETFLVPGKYVLGLILSFLQVHTEEIEPTLLTVFAGFISWIIWMAILRAIWAITLRIFGFDSRKHY